MPESKLETLPQFNSNQELVDFFDTHDMGEYEEEMPEASFDVELKREHYLVSVDGQLMSQLLEVAQGQQVSVELLVDSWLKEKLLKAS
jgi:CopG antitoxin of type II toxin-antitoxin system